MSYFFADKKLSNDVHLITHKDIRMMIEENEKDATECNRITKEVSDGKNAREPTGNVLEYLFKEIFVDQKTNGFLNQMPYGLVIRQAERNHYYRGENQIFQSSLPSLNRKLNTITSEKERQINKLVADMRIYEFKNLLYSFKHVRRWEECQGDVLFDLLAQHYGLPTHWLDITNDFMCALFFATCSYDYNKKKWFPLTREQTEQNETTKYGVIFHIPECNASILSIQAMQINDFYKNPPSVNAIFPIGFQPFMRCHMQYGYGIYMPCDAPLQNDTFFEKLKFRHDEKLSAWVFNKMQEGRLIYPHDGLSEIDDIIQQIKSSTSFSEEAFSYAFEKSSYFQDEQHCKLAIQSYIIDGLNIDIGKKASYSLSRQRHRRIERSYESFSLEESYGVNTFTRLVY